MLRLSLGLEEAASAVEEAVAATMAEGYRTADVSAGPGAAFSTAEVGAAVAERVAAGAPSAG
jgi:3-isopropylmalate dehydrogenase